MTLHESLRELVAIRGAVVVGEAEEFRGALDDFLTEDQATLGELNLLVDAVRLGALRRVLDVLDHGAAPDAAVREAGATLARDRGTDDPSRSCWALAALCYALGKVDERLVLVFRADAGTIGAPAPPTAPHGRAPQPPPASVQPPPPPPPAPTPAPGATRSMPPPTQPPSRTLEESSQAPEPPAAPPTAVSPVVPPPLARQHVPLVIPEERSGRGGRVLLVGVLVLAVAALVTTGYLLLRSDGDRDDAPAASDTGGDDEGDGGSAAEVPEDALLLSYQTGEDSRIYQVDPSGGEYRPLTKGPGDRLPAISPDRTVITVQQGARPGRETVMVTLDPESGDTERVFAEDGDCGFASRPAWSPAGDQVAVVCEENGSRTGIYLVDVSGDLPLEDPRKVLDDPYVNGVPTWVSEDTFVYASGDETGSTSTLWSFTLGSDPVQLTEEADGFLTHPDWSEDAQLLLYVRHDDPKDEFGNLWLAEHDPEVGLVGPRTSAGPYAHPVWSPSGDAIAFTVLDEDGTEVLATAEMDNLPSYSPVERVPPGEVGVPVWGTR